VNFDRIGGPIDFFSTHFVENTLVRQSELMRCIYWNAIGLARQPDTFFVPAGNRLLVEKTTSSTFHKSSLGGL